MAFDPDEWRLAEDFGTYRRPRDALARFGWPLVAGVGVALAAVGAWELASGPLETAAGLAAAPAFFRGHQLHAVAFGLLVVGVAARPLRRGEAWAWLLLWLVPLATAGDALLGRAAEGALWPGQLALAAVAALGLLLAVRGVRWPRRWR